MPHPGEIQVGGNADNEPGGSGGFGAGGGKGEGVCNPGNHAPEELYYPEVHQFVKGSAYPCCECGPGVAGGDEEDRALLAEWKGIYEQVGYVCLAVSAETGEGVEEVKALLAGKVTAVAGLSGVGKSSLLNRVEPGLGLKTAVISDAHDSGKHTTTFAEMFPLSGGGYVVDTPGVRSFGMVDMEKEEISHFFPEIFACAEGCRFYNCTHTHEPGCAVRAAVEAGEISASRYASYLSMLEGDGGKYR